MTKITTHNGILTVVNKKTNGHRTFQIKTAKNGPLKGKRIVSMLIGPNNEQDYLGLGFVQDNGFVNVWNKHKGTVYEKTLEVLNHLNDDKLPLEVLFETTCRACNRKLTNPESIISGIGPECGKIKG
jgi:hypothetical protein